MERLVAVRIKETWKQGSESIDLLAQIGTAVRTCETVCELQCVWKCMLAATENERFQ